MLSRSPLTQFGLWSVAAAALFFVASDTASAQQAAAPPPPTPDSPWLKICNTDPNTKTEICAITQELRAETGQPIATATIQTLNEAGKFGFGVVVPIGFVLPPGVTVTVDGQKKATAEFKICLPTSNQQPPACVAQAVMNQDFITALKKGNEMALVMVNPQNKPVNVKMSLAGFSKTFDGPGIDRAAAEAKRKQLSEALQKSAEEARKKLIEQQQKELQNVN